jgi:hypothetical protein
MIRPIRTFTVSPSLPPELERQRALVYNLHWAWNHDAIELFRWDGDLWEQSGHNPASTRAALFHTFRDECRAVRCVT